MYNLDLQDKKNYSITLLFYKSNFVKSSFKTEIEEIL